MGWSAEVGRFVKDCLTVANGRDYDVGRVLWVLLVLTYVGVTIFHAVRNPTSSFDYISFGTGSGMMLAGGGASLWAKKNTEPKETP